MRRDRTAPLLSSQPRRRRLPKTLAEAEKRIREDLITNRNQIRCRCGRQATDLHFTPSFEPDMKIWPACGRHDWGGYWIAVADLIVDWDDWKQHLNRKEGGGMAWGLLLDWLWRVTG
jgi:hypothetical protein